MANLGFFLLGFLGTCFVTMFFGLREGIAVNKKSKNEESRIEK